jgi:hypothetical protein
MSHRLAPRIALALGALIACLAGPALAAPTGNLLANPGFEEGMAGHPWMPAGWDTSASEDPTAFFGRDTTVVHGGRYAVSVANVSSLVPRWHNWSQGIVVGPEMWNKDVVLSVWTRNNGVQGRGYVLLQAYRDSVGKMMRLWKVSRDTALVRLGYQMTTDPFAYLGAKREYFSDTETDWVHRQVRVFIPPSTDLIIARCGLFGTGQVQIDDVSLTAEPALPPPALPVGVNLLQDPGFEGNGDAWEYSLPPYDEMRCDRDTTVVHSGKASLRFTGGMIGMVKTRAGVAQVIGNRGLAGKRVRLSGWIKCDSLLSMAYIKLYCTTLERDENVGAPQQIGNTTPWTWMQLEMDVPKGAYQVWAWLLYNAPSEGRVYFDDASLEVVGPALGSPPTGTPATPPVKPGSARKPGPKGTATP